MVLNQNITLLTGSNWELWKHKVKVLFVHYAIWEFVEKTKESDKPAVKTLDSAANKSETEPEKNDLTWREKQDEVEKEQSLHRYISIL